MTLCNKDVSAVNFAFVLGFAYMHFFRNFGSIFVAVLTNSIVSSCSVEWFNNWSALQENLKP